MEHRIERVKVKLPANAAYRIEHVQMEVELEEYDLDSQGFLESSLSSISSYPVVLVVYQKRLLLLVEVLQAVVLELECFRSSL